MSKDTEKNCGGRHKGVAAPKSGPGEIPEREAALLINRYNGRMTIADATIEAGYQCGSRHSANVLGGQIIRKHKNANSELIQALERHGVTIEKIAEVIEKGLSAEMPAKQGSSVLMVPDYRTRHHYAETALDISGGRAPKHITFESTTYEQRMELLSEIRKNPEHAIDEIKRILLSKQVIEE